jgi:hypothetical protein
MKLWKVGSDEGKNGGKMPVTEAAGRIRMLRVSHKYRQQITNSKYGDYGLKPNVVNLRFVEASERPNICRNAKGISLGLGEA